MNAPKTRRFSLRKALKLLLIVLLVFSLSSVLISAVAFRVLFPRNDGKPTYRTVYAEVDPAVYPRTEFYFPSGNCQLRGCYYPAQDARGLVIVVNGIGADIDAHLPEILYFLDRGWSAVSWDATGVGQSEGRGLIGLQQIKRDLLAFLDYQAEQPFAEGLPTVIYGHSAGAYAAAGALATDYPIDGAVCVSGFDAPVDVMLYHARRYVGPLADLEYPFLLLENFALFGPEANASAVAAINAAKTPVLIFEGSSDDLVPRELGLCGGDYSGNGQVRCRTVDARWRCEHSTLWLSEDAAAYVGTLTEYTQADKNRANELDAAFMEEVLSFFEAAAARHPSRLTP